MNLSDIQKQVVEAANEFALSCKIYDQTAHTINLRIIIDRELFIQIYANTKKNKLNLALVLHGNRLCGTDKEGGIYHLHPFSDPSVHMITNKEKAVLEFVSESMIFLNERCLI